MEKVSTDKLVEDLNAVVHDAEDLLKATAGQTGEAIAELRNRTQESLGRARKRIKEAGLQVGERARAAAHSTDEYVHDNPWMAIGIAAGIGFLLGTLSRRR